MSENAYFYRRKTNNTKRDMQNMEDYSHLKGFKLEGSVLVAWKAKSAGKREFIGIYFADGEDTMEDILAENKLSENKIKHNVLVPEFQLTELNEAEKKSLVIENLKNEIWDWDSSYNFEEAAGELF